MEDIFRYTSLYPDVQSVIFNYMTEISEEIYWQEVYKGYFSQFVLPEINQGWQIVGFNNISIFCFVCVLKRETDPNCCNCSMTIPCINCYYYGYGGGEGLCGERCEQWGHVSWKQISGMISDDNNYRNYTEFRKTNIYMF